MERIEKAIEYALMIESWDDLVDPWTLTFYNLGFDPFSYVLQPLSIEEKKSKCWCCQGVISSVSISF